MNLCVIPARGGSKRIPGKNIKGFCGKPIIAYPIAAALESGCFNKVLVSTDDQKIAEVAVSYGADVPFVRPAELSDDHTSASAATGHAVSWLREQGQDYEYTCTLYATSPFVEPGFLRDSLRMLQDNPTYTFCFSTTPFRAPIQRALKRNGDGSAEMFLPENYYVRSQDLEPAFHDAGQFYWGRSQAWVDKLAIFLERSLMFVLPNSHVEDIDTPDDWIRAERMYRIIYDDKDG
jgi:pseudaminic acid cytidylyltransferase